MGRHRKPIEQLKQNGTYKPSRHAGPEPETAVPVMPADLAGAAAEFWQAASPVLTEMGVYTEADAFALRLLCESYGYYREACDMLEADGHYVELTNKNGSKYIAEHPAGKVRARHWKQVVDMLRRFGMTPSDRNGLSIRKPDNSGESELERILRQGRN